MFVLDACCCLEVYIGVVDQLCRLIEPLWLGSSHGDHCRVVLIVHQGRWPLVGADLVEGVSGEVPITHGLLVDELIERLLHAISNGLSQVLTPYSPILIQYDIILIEHVDC
ncbi:hypothetical protein Halar_0216 (plasmid) [halophilic archaeon DL31]|nr:hypothetical protein Halar_0216 [halophilic archaeon DL31]